ncbi:MAG: hypothetical protein K0R76_376 [Alphaproteobacteria bacterium]|nr:hypothetical protein [Alphaproteobacteria bacterium]
MKTLSVTLADKLYDRIKHTVPPRQISKFVSEAVEIKLEEQANELYKAYTLAAQDPDREEVLRDWDAIDIDSWEETR